MLLHNDIQERILAAFGKGRDRGISSDLPLAQKQTKPGALNLLWLQLGIVHTQLLNFQILFERFHYEKIV